MNAVNPKSNYHKITHTGSQPSQSGENLSSQSESENLAKSPENMGLAAISVTPLEGNSGGTGKSENKGENLAPETKVSPVSAKPKSHKKPKATKVAKPTVTPTPGPEGYKADCAEMPFGKLKAAYTGEFNSWKGRKAFCKKQKPPWLWDSLWESFKGFLLSMKPMPGPGYTLERKLNHVHAYGPDHCEWADKTTQNNNKSDNKKFVIPFIDGVWTPQKLAKLHKVSVKTIYKRWDQILSPWSPLELLAGKKCPPIRELWLKLDELPKSPVGKKVTNPLILKEFRARHPDEEWPFCEADVIHEELTGKMIDTEYVARRAEYDALAAWAAIVNAGLPVPPLPELKWLKFTPPTQERMAQLYNKPAKPAPKPQMAPSVIGYAPDDPEDDHDPTDCMPDPDED